MITIRGYDVPVREGDLQLTMLKNAKILTVQVQYLAEEPYIWVVGDTEEETEVRYFRLIYAGCHRKMDPREIKQYIGSFQMKGAPVCHLFEIHEKEVV